MSVARWLLLRKCSDTVVGVEGLVCLSTGLRCSLKRSLSLGLVFPYVLFVTAVALCHVNDIFGVPVNVLFNDLISLVSPVE